jgi:hypothetical protein
MHHGELPEDQCQKLTDLFKCGMDRQVDGTRWRKEVSIVSKRV